ncbi:MAG: hypothetical protein HY738_07235, partial [Bacteroidia bacterium]|nr:hypothetical protein [Bacteroidia bacterium]
NDENIIIYHATIKNTSNKAVDMKLIYMLNRMQEICFCTVDMNKSKPVVSEVVPCRFVAGKNLDLNIVKKLFNNSGYSVEFDMRQPFTKENFLRIYTTKNSAPVFIDTRNPEKDKYNFQLATTAWQELQIK